MGDCPATCCKGWLIPVDDDTLIKYNRLKGTDYIKYILSLREKSGIKCFNTNLKKCTFLDKDGLCSLQKKYGEEYLSEVCRIFPRTDYNIFRSCEDASVPVSTLFFELSCPKVAELFVRNSNNMKIINSTHETSGEISTTNDDIDFYKFLILLNDSINKIICDRNYSLHEIYAFLLNLGQKLQDLFILNESCDAITKINEYIDSNKLFDFAFNGESDIRNYYISAVLTDKIMTGGYYHPRVKGESGLLYKLCRLYFEEFDKMKISDIDSVLKNLTSEIKIDSSLDYKMDDFLRNHLWYILSASFAEIFEDYSFQLKFVIAIIRNQMLAMFAYLYSEHISPLDSDNLVKLLYSFSRRGAGSDGLYADFARVVIRGIDCDRFIGN